MSKEVASLHVPCDIKGGCGSSDAMTIYADGSKYCFSCQQSWFPKHMRGQQHDMDTTPGLSIAVEPIELPELTPRSIGRGITAETMRKYGAGFDDQNRLWQVYYYNGQPVGAKIKSHGPNGEKKFTWVGSKQHVSLYGLHIANHRYKLIITEGELDAMAAHQMTGYAAVSLPFGGGSGKLDYIKRALPYIEQVETVYICTDMDEPGREASNQLMEIISAGKAREVFLPLKDACDMLAAGKAAEFKDALFAAQPRIPSGIMSPAELVRESMALVYDKDKRVGISTGIQTVDARIGGYRPAELSGWVADTGVGKSTLIRQLMYNLALQGHKCMYVPLEDEPAVSSLQLAALKLGELTITPDEYPDPKRLEEALWWVVDHIVFMNHVGCLDVDALKTNAEFALRASNIKVVFLDHITAMAEGGGESATRIADQAVAEFRKLARKHKLHVAIVSHIRKPDNVKTDKETGEELPVRPTKRMIKHASSIPQACNWMFGLFPTQFGIEVFEMKGARSFPPQTTKTSAYLSYDHTDGSLSDGSKINPELFTTEVTHEETPAESSRVQGRHEEGTEQIRGDDADSDTGPDGGELRGSTTERPDSPSVHPGLQLSSDERHAAEDPAPGTEGELPAVRRSETPDEPEAAATDPGAGAGSAFWDEL